MLWSGRVMHHENLTFKRGEPAELDTSMPNSEAVIPGLYIILIHAQCPNSTAAPSLVCPITMGCYTLPPSRPLIDTIPYPLPLHFL